MSSATFGSCVWFMMGTPPSKGLMTQYQAVPYDRLKERLLADKQKLLRTDPKVQ